LKAAAARRADQPVVTVVVILLSQYGNEMVVLTVNHTDGMIFKVAVKCDETMTTDEMATEVTWPKA